MNGNGYSVPCFNRTTAGDDMYTTTPTPTDSVVESTSSSTHTTAAINDNVHNPDITNMSDTSTTDTYQTTTPIPPIAKVTFKATLSMSSAAFTADKQRVYLQGVANALAVSISDMSIGEIIEIQVRRRLLATSIEVETIALVPEENAQSVSSSVTSENINAQLASAGMGVQAISPPVMEIVIPETVEPEQTDTACGAGKYSSFDKSTCVTCPSGMYSTATNALSFSTCIPCALSTYSAAIGATSSGMCIPCETGKFTSRVGAIWIGQCTKYPHLNTC